MSIGRTVLFGTLLSKNIVKDSIFSPKCTPLKIDGKPTFILIGGELFNKGAQAMTFSAVDALRNNFSDANIFLFSSKEFSQDRTEEYEFRTLPWDEDVKLHLLGYNGDLLRKRSWDLDIIDEVQTVFRGATAVFDISGYSLSSQLGIETTVSYMTDILLARKYNVPYYILPQSIGPFNYGTPAQYIAGAMFRVYFPYASLICPREASGVDAVNQYTSNNVQLERDIVLQRPDYTVSNISSDLDVDVPKIKPGSVGLVPNQNVIEYTDQNMINFYREAIETAKQDCSVYILRHSADDERLCDQLYNHFEDNAQVHNLNKDFNAIQLEKIISNFSYIVGSRYHSLIHAYRAGVPAVVISWAEKYKELANVFDQSDHLLDCRQNIDVAELRSTIKHTYEKNNEIRDSILSSYQNIQNSPYILDTIFQEMNERNQTN